MLGKFGLDAQRYGKHANLIFFRREMPQSDDLIERAKEIYLPLHGTEWHEQKKMFVFKAGGRIRFRPLENDMDSQKYQGQNILKAAIEEAGSYNNPSCIWKLFGALRSAGGAPIQLILSFNPGGAGHHWLKEKFINPAPLGLKVLTWKLPTGRSVPYVYIPSRVTDNKLLMLKDPGYIDRLHMVGSPELVRAWLEGDFSIHEGSYFPEFGARHIIAPLSIPSHWQRYLGYDWGFRSPFAAVWGAISSGKDDSGREVPYPKGAVIIYRELWGKQVDNVDQARKLAELGRGENPIAVADPSIFSEEGGPSISDQFNRVFSQSGHPSFRRADNHRISGWSEIRRRLLATPPMLYISTACPYLLESLPAQQMCPKNAEDLDTTGDDHAVDALRYLCKERLLSTDHKKEIATVKKGMVQLGQYIKESRSQQKRARL